MQFSVIIVLTVPLYVIVSTGAPAKSDSESLEQLNKTNAVVVIRINLRVFMVLILYL
ncbi:hypothetical protein FCR2A7T_18570 [Flavobacterium cauense R2A-7]|nr:hypothetical protein FCR2A7T_18570 [Flavobacterium cauense R2A-7]